MMNNRPLWKISVAISGEVEEPVGSLLERIFGRTATIEIDAESGATKASVFLEQKSGLALGQLKQLQTGLKLIRKCGLELGSGKISVRKVRRENWAESWKRHFKPLVIGSSLLVKPPWSKRRAKKNQAVIILNPGLSFGTGQHPTTRFCLEQLANCREEGQSQSCLDIGTGSGILAIAAVKLGYGPVEGIDFDPGAIRVAEANVRRNKVGNKVRLLRQDLARLPTRSSRKYEVICANVEFPLLLAQGSRIMARLKTGGVLVLAGILQSQFPLIQQAYEGRGLKLIRSQIQNGWHSGMFRSEVGYFAH